MSTETAELPAKAPENAQGIERSPASVPPSTDAPERKEQAAEPEGEHKEGPDKKGEVKPPSKWTYIIGGVILAAAITSGVLYYIHTLHFASTDDAYTTGHTHEISSRIAGTVLEVKVDDNQHVKAGQPLLTLDPRDNDVALQRARAQLDQSRAQVSNAQASILQAQGDLAQREAQTSQIEAQLQKAQLDFDRTNGLSSRQTW